MREIPALPFDTARGPVPGGRNFTSFRMPKDSSSHKILEIGSGPIVIGQSCEFDCSGVQDCKALKEERHTVVLLRCHAAKGTASA